MQHLRAAVWAMLSFVLVSEGLGADPAPLWIAPGPTVESTLYSDGSTLPVPTETRWRYICGTPPSAQSVEHLSQVAAATRAEMLSAEQFTVIDQGLHSAGIDIVFTLGPSVPAEAHFAIQMAEAYLESLFSDPIQVAVYVSFQNMGSGGALGSTGSGFTGGIGWATSRQGLQLAADSDDVIQAFLPLGSTIPVRYNGASATVTNEDRVFWTRANYRSTIGTLPVQGSDDAGVIVVNSFVNFDYDPTNGVPTSHSSLVDVMVHEVGHALGFVSNADGFGNDINALDIFRFQMSDGAEDYNPDTLAEFQVRPRLVDFNAPGTNDDVVTDLIDVEHRMSDGDPWQASHFRQPLFGNAALMQPSIGNGQTRYPHFFSDMDIEVFDAIGYDYPPGGCPPVVFGDQPEPQTVCAGQTVQFTVSVAPGVTPSYQWYKDGAVILDGPKYSGVATPTLTVASVSAADVGAYQCVVTDSDCGNVNGSIAAQLSVQPAAQIVTQPADQTVNAGESCLFHVVISGAVLPQFQWRRNGQPLVEAPPFIGVNAQSLFITNVQPEHAGEFDCVITDAGSPALCSVTSSSATLTVRGGGSPCPGDLDGDSDVDLADLGQLLAAFGVGPGGDIDGDNDTDLGDLGALLSQYGLPCP